MKVCHWYHVWVGEGSAWREPVFEHLQALARGGYDGRFKVGIVGPPGERAEALELIAAQRPPDVVRQFDDGWEQCTLQCVRADARRHRDNLTLYAHTKGASHGSGQTSHWRRSMTCALLANLPSHMSTLDTGVDAVGCHWLNPLPSGGRGFAGNFWMARNDFLATLPPVPVKNRHQAESWIGSGNRAPRLVDLNPGYPGEVPWVRAIGWPR